MLGFGAISSLAISALPEWRVWINAYSSLAASEGDYRIFAATGEYITLATDTPANTPFLGTLRQSMAMRRSIIGGRGFTQLQQSWGEFELHNLEADYDQFATGYAFDGREVTFKVGDPTGAFSAFHIMAVLQMVGEPDVQEDVMRIKVRDKTYLLEVPAQTGTYAGTGDLEGPSDLAGKRKPVVYGAVLNVTPAFVIPAELVYQVHDRAVSAISAVYDQGYALTFSANYATAALLRAAAISDGYYATCVAEGLFRLGAAASLVTADVLGDASGGYVNTTGTIVRRLIGRASAVIDPTDLDTVSFSNIEVAQPAQVGFYLGPEASETVADVVGKLMGGIGGHAGFTRLGKFQVQRITAPSGPNAAEYDDVDVVEISRIALPDSIYPPSWRQRVAYGRNWTVIADAAAGVDASRKAFLDQAYKVASTTDATIQGDYLAAQDPEPVEAYFVSEADALAEAVRVQALFGAGYRLYRVVVKDHPLIHDIGQCVKITYPRWNLGAGRQCRIVEIAEDADKNEVELTVFG